MIEGTADRTGFEHDINELRLLKFYSWTYANAGARTGATGFVANDIGRVAWQLDNDTFWMLKAITPVWVQI